MLVLSRKSTESIHIGDSVVVTVLQIRGNKARIGIEAPKEIPVLRSELHVQIAAQLGNVSPTNAASPESGDTRAIGALETDGPSG